MREHVGGERGRGEHNWKCRRVRDGPAARLSAADLRAADIRTNFPDDGGLTMNQMTAACAVGLLLSLCATVQGGRNPQAGDGSSFDVVFSNDGASSNDAASSKAISRFTVSKKFSI